MINSLALRMEAFIYNVYIDEKVNPLVVDCSLNLVNHYYVQLIKHQCKAFSFSFTNFFSSARDVVYRLYSSTVGVVMSSRGSVKAILLEWEPLHHPNAWKINHFHALTLKNLLSTTCGWNDECNGELEMLYAYLG